MSAVAWDGEALPEGAALRAAVLDPEVRARLVKVGVVDGRFAAVLDGLVPALLAEEGPEALGAGLLLAHAGCARHHAGRVAELLERRPAALVGVPDPARPGQSLGQSALRFLVEVPGPAHRAAQRGIQAALAHAELRLEAWRALADEDPQILLPHLASLLEAAPELADPVGTRFALVHTAHAEAAAAAVAGLPEATRRAFAGALKKHLLRIYAVKRWVACRRILFGR